MNAAATEAIPAVYPVLRLVDHGDPVSRDYSEIPREIL